MLRISNPPNPWESVEAEWLGEPPEARLEVFEERARTILAENESPDVGFRWSVNPYRGCFHACSYCYARSSHEYLGFGAGTDFERKIVVKVNAPELLEKELRRGKAGAETIALSGNTDCYQPLEAVYGLTRRCLEVCAGFSQSVGIITKAALVRRDIDLLARMARQTAVSVTISIPFADDAMARLVEPGTSPPSQRFETLALLSEAGIPTCVGVAPIIPGLNDDQLAEILERARDAGATEAFRQPVRLSGATLPVFRERLAAAFPERARKVERAILEMRSGSWNESRFHRRMQGQGARWEAIDLLFKTQCRRLGFGQGRAGASRSNRRFAASQPSLFDEPAE